MPVQLLKTYSRLVCELTDFILPGKENRLLPFFAEIAMSDDLSNRGEPDRSRINMSEKHEVRYWTEALGLTEVELQRLVDEVGSTAEAVRNRLKRPN